MFLELPVKTFKQLSDGENSFRIPPPPPQGKYRNKSSPGGLIMWTVSQNISDDFFSCLSTLFDINLFLNCGSSHYEIPAPKNNVFLPGQKIFFLHRPLSEQKSLIRNLPAGYSEAFKVYEPTLLP